MRRWRAGSSIWALYLVGWVSQLLLLSPASSQASSPFYLLILMDASGSMKVTDPQGFRKLAAQAVVTLLSPQDRVAIVEFDADGRIRSDWHPASDRAALWRAIQEVGQAGAFTDFRAGLETALDLMKKAPSSARRVILLLTDGILEPNPRDDRYAPYHLEYLRATLGKDRAEQMRLYQEQFRERLGLVARRILETDILPALKREGIEIYAVGFGPTVDKPFLETLSQGTTQRPQEVHAFYIQEAIDWVPAFLKLLAYWDDRMLFHVEEGDIQGGTASSLFVDEFMRDVALIVVTQDVAALWVKDPQGQEVAPLAGTHPNLRVVPLALPPPARWTYGFTHGSGRYRLMVVGRSSISLEVVGLQAQYLHGQEVRAHVRVRLGPRDARPLLDPSSRVMVEVSPDRGPQVQQALNVEREDFVFRYRPPELGTLRLKFTLFGRDRQGREMLPRPTREYRLEVVPSFFVEPARLDFGRVKRGQEAYQEVKIHSGLPGRTSVRMEGHILAASRCKDNREKLPQIREDTFWVTLGEVIQRPVRVGIPRRGCWGDFEGEVTFRPEGSPPYTIQFRVHVPSLWEYATYGVVILLAVTTLGLLGVIFYTIQMGKPVGVLRPIQVPPGNLGMPIHLGRVRRGFLKKCLRRHIIRVGSEKADILLPGLREGVRVSFIFYRWMRPQLRNDSDPRVAQDAPVEVLRSGYPLGVPIGKSCIFGRGDHIRIDTYIFEYQV